MKSAKKVVVAVLMVGVLSAAGAALAAPNQGRTPNAPVGPRPMEAQRWDGGNRIGESGRGNNFCPAPWAGMPAVPPCCCGAVRQPWGPQGQMPGRGMNGFAPRRFEGPAFGQREAQGPQGRQQPSQQQRVGRFTPDMPKEVRAKVVEAAKLRVDLEDVLTQKPLNRERAAELDGQIAKLEQEIRAWRFQQRLNRIEEGDKKPMDQPKPEVKPDQK